MIAERLLCHFGVVVPHKRPQPDGGGGPQKRRNRRTRDGQSLSILESGRPASDGPHVGNEHIRDEDSDSQFTSGSPELALVDISVRCTDRNNSEQASLYGIIKADINPVRHTFKCNTKLWICALKRALMMRSSMMNSRTTCCEEPLPLHEPPSSVSSSVRWYATKSR